MLKRIHRKIYDRQWDHPLICKSEQRNRPPVVSQPPCRCGREENPPHLAVSRSGACQLFFISGPFFSELDFLAQFFGVYQEVGDGTEVVGLAAFQEARLLLSCKRSQFKINLRFLGPCFCIVVEMLPCQTAGTRLRRRSRKARWGRFWNRGWWRVCGVGL